MLLPVPVLVVLLVPSGPVLSWGSASSSSWVPVLPGRLSRCEAVRVPLCRRMPWNVTRLPNHLHHSTQENAALALEPYLELVASGCSPALAFFLCAMFAPICALELLPEPVRPCRSLCQSVRGGCEPLLRRYNHSWPPALDCHGLPEYESAVCIAPEAIVTDLPPGCPFSPKTSLVWNQPFTFALCVAVIHAKVNSLERGNCNEITTMVDVKEVLKSSTPVPRSLVPLYTNSSCQCPPLQPNQDVLIMCYEWHSRLMLLDGCLVEKWKDPLSKRFKRWEQRLQEQKLRAAPNKSQNAKNSGRSGILKQSSKTANPVPAGPKKIIKLKSDQKEFNSKKN
ncbi:hypothetical protein JD844_002626 [Phrynosoma platyrhinos]|uniref:Secreted frizzled-related protein 4 n=1 Tax=Phrynosoma platyrhinos TaxID=52577 RepID=A0ABQ7TCA7_PHRPL|nr:hypothetical protein JD844_002626 [Phrynosoma platyrhinos]